MGERGSLISIIARANQLSGVRVPEAEKVDGKEGFLCFSVFLMGS